MRTLRHWLLFPIPAGGVALVLLLTLGGLHAAGAREQLVFLTGQLPAGGAASVTLGLAYLGVWLLTLLAAPPLALGAAISALDQCWTSSESKTPPMS